MFFILKAPSPYLKPITFENFEDLILLSPSEIKQELCE